MGRIRKEELYGRKRKRFSYFCKYNNGVVVSDVFAPICTSFSFIFDKGIYITAKGYSFLIRDLDFSAYRYLFASGDSILRAYGMTLLVTAIGTILNLFMTLFLHICFQKKICREEIYSHFMYFLRCFFQEE